MPLPIPRFTIGRLMAAVAVAAGFFTLVRMMSTGTGPVAAVLMLPLISVLAIYPVRYAHSGRWLLIATWVVALWPLSIVGSVHAGFGIATVVLGHPPRPSDNGHLINLLEMSVFLCWISSLITTLSSFCLPFLAANRSDEQPDRWNPQVIPILMMTPVWLSVLGIIRWDPVGAMSWWLD